MSKMIMKYDYIERMRRTPNKSLLIFMTDRCPVGCAHCSVDSQKDSPTITNRELFKDILKYICSLTELETVGISGGEPFVEKWGLIEAMEQLTKSGKRVALFTSGVWAINKDPPEWIENVLSKASCVFLSTDLYHQTRIPDSYFLNALQIAKLVGTWVIVQVIDKDEMVRGAELLLERAYGDEWNNYAEIIKTYPLSYGRGTNTFGRSTELKTADQFEVCPFLNSPCIRYDGVVTACCNEHVVMGNGSERLRGQIDNRNNIDIVLHRLKDDEIHNLIRQVGINQMISLPLFKDIDSLKERKFHSICEACWEIQNYIKSNPIDNHWRLLIKSLLHIGSTN